MNSKICLVIQVVFTLRIGAGPVELEFGRFLLIQPTGGLVGGRGKGRGRGDILNRRAIIKRIDRQFLKIRSISDTIPQEFLSQPHCRLWSKYR